MITGRFVVATESGDFLVSTQFDSSMQTIGGRGGLLVLDLKQLTESENIIEDLTKLNSAWLKEFGHPDDESNMYREIKDGKRGWDKGSNKLHLNIKTYYVDWRADYLYVLNTTKTPFYIETVKANELVILEPMSIGVLKDGERFAKFY